MFQNYCKLMHAKSFSGCFELVFLDIKILYVLLFIFLCSFFPLKEKHNFIYKCMYKLKCSPKCKYSWGNIFFISSVAQLP